MRAARSIPTGTRQLVMGDDASIPSRLLVGATTVVMPHVARAADTLSVRTDFFPWSVHVALHLCNVNGWFKDAGLTVDVQDGRGSANTLQLVNAGQVDVGQIQVGMISQAMAPARG